MIGLRKVPRQDNAVGGDNQLEIIKETRCQWLDAVTVKFTVRESPWLPLLTAHLQRPWYCSAYIPLITRQILATCLSFFEIARMINVIVLYRIVIVSDWTLPNSLRSRYLNNAIC